MHRIEYYQQGECIMNTLLAVLITATLGTSPIQYLNNVKNGDFSYVCYIQNENLMLLKLNKDFSFQKKDVVDTGISTESFEKVTMTAHDNNVIIEVRYKTDERIEAEFNAKTLELSQVKSIDSKLLAELEIVR